MSNRDYSKARMGTSGAIQNAQRQAQFAQGGPLTDAVACNPAPSDSLGYVGSRLWDVHDRIHRLNHAAGEHLESLTDQLNRICGYPPPAPVGDSEDAAKGESFTGTPRGHVADLHAAVDALHMALNLMEARYAAVQEQMERLHRVTA